MLEFSAVPVPANPEALMLAISKGLVLSDVMKKELHVEEPEPIVEEEPKNYMPEIKTLQAEIEQAHQKEVAALNIIAGLEKEISDLRYQIYTLLHKPEPTPEISGKAIADMIGEAVTGEIRRVTGKV
jgi:hypothetical protein